MSDGIEIKARLEGALRHLRAFASASASASFSDEDGSTWAEYAELHGENEERLEAVDALPLEMYTTRQAVIVLGTGGPHTELVVQFGRFGGVDSMQWRGVWGAETVVHDVLEGSPLWELGYHWASALDD